MKAPRLFLVVATEQYPSTRGPSHTNTGTAQGPVTKTLADCILEDRTNVRISSNATVVYLWKSKLSFSDFGLYLSFMNHSLVDLKIVVLPDRETSVFLPVIHCQSLAVLTVVWMSLGPYRRIRSSSLCSTGKDTSELNRNPVLSSTQTLYGNTETAVCTDVVFL